MDRYDDLRQTQMLQPGDKCEFRFPARSEWLPGIVVDNGGGSYWSVRPTDSTNRDVAEYFQRNGDDATISSLYIEHVRAPNTDPWGY